MPVYEFSFPVEAGGLTLTFSGAHTGSVSLPDDGVYLLDADTEGLDESSVIVGEVSSSLLGTMQARGVYQTQASIGAGGGVVLDGANYLFEINTPATVNIASGSLEWDTAPDGITPGPIIVGLPAGLYVADLEVYFTQPADDVALTAKFECVEFICRSGPYTIYSTGSDNAFTLRASGLMRVQSLSSNVSAHFSGAVVNGGAITTLDVDYASLILTPISN